jgi:hypothetical protein
VISTLKAAFVQGRLTKDELDLRVGQTFGSRTYADLAAVTADLPAGLAAAQPARPARARGGPPVLRPGTAIVAANLLYAAIWPVAAFLPQGFMLVELAGAGYLVVIVAALAWWRILESRQDRHSGGQRRRRRASGAGRQAPPLPSASSWENLRPGEQGRPRPAEAARRRLSRPAIAVRSHRAAAPVRA